MSANAAVTVEKTNFQGWPSSYRIANAEVELVVTGDIGPRIMRYAFIGGKNLFKEFKETLGKSGEPAWVLRGGHRIWRAPEDAVLTYAPDNGPVKIEQTAGGVVATQPVEPLTGLEKQIAVKLAPAGSAVTVTHRIKNATAKQMEIAAWALTMMAQGGVGIHGFPPRGKHPDILYATNPLVMWAFTDLTDKRLQFTKKYLMLRQDPANATPNKVGTFNKDTWGAYLLGTDLFLKRTVGDPAGVYPDFNSSFETFTNADFLELETLGPMTKLAAGESLEHVEHWTLHKNVRISSWTDEALDRALLPLLQAAPR